MLPMSEFPSYNLLRKIAPEGRDDDHPFDLFYDYCQTMVHFSGVDHCISAMHAILQGTYDLDLAKTRGWNTEVLINVHPPRHGEANIQVVGIPQENVEAVEARLQFVFGNNTMVYELFPKGEALPDSQFVRTAGLREVSAWTLMP